jgi:hypothetical protein
MILLKIKDYWYLTTVQTKEGYYYGIECDFEYDDFWLTHNLKIAEEKNFIFKKPPIKNLNYNMVKCVFEHKLILKDIIE